MTRSLRVLFSFGVPASDANPYVMELVHSIQPIEAVYFSWRAAIGGRYNVFHVHWPEVLTRSPSRPRRYAKTVLLLLLVLRLAVTRVPVVRTVHNLRPHEPGLWLERICLALLDRITTVRVVMNAHELNNRGRTVLIPHGSYIQVVGRTVGRALRQRDPTQVLYFGHIRPYKGLEELSSAWGASASASSGSKLVIAGKPLDEQVEREVRGLFDSVPGVELRLRYLPESELYSLLTASSMVVLPYERLHNSGAALLALSCGTPILVPDGPTTAELEGEFGSSWVSRYSRLTPEVVDKARLAFEVGARANIPDLRHRSWSKVGAMHIALYRQVVSNPRQGRVERRDSGRR